MENKKQFIDNSYIEVIYEFMKCNNGYVTSRQMKELDIHRMYLNIMIDKGMIERVEKGVYMDKSIMEDIYYVFQLRYPKTVFSGFTALYFHELTEKFPYNLEVTVKVNYHSKKIEKDYYVSRCKDEIFALGITEVKTPSGNIVKAYDKERCICDIIKNKDKYDYEQVKKAVREYVKGKNKSNSNLSIYSKKMNINKEVMEFVGMYYE